MGQDLHLVGSIPLDTVEEVFRTFGGPLGQALATMPDGEVGPRSHWISRIPQHDWDGRRPGQHQAGDRLVTGKDVRLQ